MKKVFNIKKFIIFIILVIIISISVVFFGYSFLISEVSKKGNNINVYIKEGMSYSSIAPILKEKGVIRSELAYKIYIKLNKPSKALEFGDYVLNTSYDVEKIVSVLESGSISLAKTVSVTFIEGKNVRHFIKKVTDNFDISESEILDKLSDSAYLDTLIDDYWFLTDEIKNKDLYYSLEGYLYPDTYEFYSYASIDDIFRKLLDNMGSKLEPYKESISKNNRTIHEMITLSSIVELEGLMDSDRRDIAGVFYNRLADGWSLGSDVTTYYAEKIDDFVRDLYQSELNECNAYNTRSTCMYGKLPVGPICNPSLSSLIASIEPNNHDYYYFVADKNGKSYFNKTDYGHNSTIDKLKREGLWFTY